MKKQDIRWQQRFITFEKALLRLQEALGINDASELERNGIVKRFEFTLELAWKTLKDYMQSEGLSFPLTPKGTLRQAQQSQLIDNVQVLIDAWELRNELAHDYDELKFELAEVAIRDEIFPAIEKLYRFLLEQLKKNQLGLF